MRVINPNDPQISSLRIQSFEANSSLFASSLTLLSTNLCFFLAISLLLKYMKPTLFKFVSIAIWERIFPAFSILSEIPKIFFATLEKSKYPKRLKRLLYLKKPESSFGITRPGAQVITEILLEDIFNFFASSLANKILHNLLFL